MNDTIKIDVELQFRGPLAEHLAQESEARRVDPAELLADIIETVFNDQLVGAVLDK